MSTAIDIPATKEKMRLINKRAFLREMAAKHPSDNPVSPEVLTMILNGNYPALGGRRATQVIGYLREAGFLVELDDSDRKVAA